MESSWRVSFGLCSISSLLILLMLSEAYSYNVNHVSESIVSITRGDGRNCSGVIVSSHDVLTTVNCTQGPSNYILIRAGTNFRHIGGSIHHVANVTIHERFRFASVPVFDVALIRVIEAFNATKTKPIKLFHHILRPGTTAMEVKWGPSSTYQEELKFAVVPIVNHTNCNYEYWNFGGIHEGQICTVRNATRYAPCSDNSGVPLIVDGAVAGIFSFSQGCHSDKPAVYTEVAYFYDWIQSRLYHEKHNATGHKPHFPSMGSMGSMIGGAMMGGAIGSMFNGHNQNHNANPGNPPAQHPHDPNAHSQHENKPISNIMGKLGPALMNHGNLMNKPNTKNGKSHSNNVIASSVIFYILNFVVVLILSK